MQLLKASSEVLIKPLNTVIGIVERRSTMPILANILIKKNGNRVDFTATDLEVEISTTVDIGVGDEAALVTVSARKFLEVLRALPSGGIVDITLEDNKLQIICGRSRFSLQTMPGEDFPPVEQPDSWRENTNPGELENTFVLPQKTLKRLFNMVSFAMAKQDIRYYLNGILLVVEPGKVRAVATDGHRLAHLSEDIETPVSEEQQLILPAKTVIELQRLLDDSDEPVYISLHKDTKHSQIRFTFGDIVLVSKLIEGRFPDYKRVIPSDYDRHLAINREEFQSNLQRARILVANDRLHGIKLNFSDNQLKIYSNNQDQEEATNSLAIEYPFEPLEVGFNVNYLLDVLSVIKDEEISVSVKPVAGSSVIINLLSDENFKYVVMPLRI
ncbi:DNA polymerase III subunit beta [Oligella ureolytica]|nr:DNA polymerase III subunit beta [Alcaligenaceae bacterium]HZJ98216.1 DNA polymerase III subunit beta [Oligella sp.]